MSHHKYRRFRIAPHPSGIHVLKSKTDQAPPVRRARRGAKHRAAGTGLKPVPWRASEARRRQGWKPKGARRHRWLDAQHDSATRQSRGTHRNPWNLQCVFVQNLRNTKPTSRICVNPQNRTFVKATLCPCTNPDLLICVKPYIRKPVDQQNRSNVKSPQHTAGRSITGVRKTPRRKAGRQGDVQSPLLRDQIRLCTPASPSTRRA